MPSKTRSMSQVLYSTTEAGEVLGVTRAMVHRYIINGHLRAHQPGGMRGYKITAIDLVDFMEGRREKGK